MHRPSLAGGVKSSRLISEALVRRGHEVNIIYLATPSPWPSPLRVRTFARRLWYETRMLGRARHHLVESTANLIPVRGDRIEANDVPDADACLASWWECREWIEPWPASKGAKVYVIRHHELWGRDDDRVRATYRMPGTKVVIAKWLQRLMADEYGDPGAIWVPNGVDWEQFDSQPRPRPERPTVGMLYGIVGWKGAETAFEAVRLAQRAHPDLRLVAFGRMPVAREHTPPANFEFHLRPDQALIPELYRRCHAWLVPSTIEGLGMPGLEAAAGHCPIVATRSGGPEDYVDDGVSGHLVPVGDAPAMAEAIGRVLDLPGDDWAAMSRASYAVARRFDWDDSAERLEQALLAAVEGRRRSA
jgi:glycosyltransferase involved in cell wall biosynthesis